MTRPHRCTRHGKSRPVGAGASPWRVGALRRARPLAWACALALRRAAQTGQSVVSTGCCVDATRGVGADSYRRSFCHGLEAGFPHAAQVVVAVHVGGAFVAEYSQHLVRD
jgi:hypothetical protein